MKEQLHWQGLQRAQAVCGLLLALLLLQHVEGKEARIPVVVGLAAYDEFPFWYDAGDGNYTGFLAPILEHLCTNAQLDCTRKYLPTLSGMVPAVVDGTVDFVLSILSVTANRAKRVEFVNPGFYSAGVALYTAPTEGTLIAAAGGWDSLAGTPICFVRGYYATDALVQQYSVVPVEQETVQDAVQAVSDGNCTAFAYDTGLPDLGLPQAAGVQSVLDAAYAIPVAKGNTTLRHRLSAALVDLMSSGNDSPLLEWEQRYLTDQGVLSNPNLFEVVKAISYFE